MANDTTFAASFTGSTWASPLYLDNGPGGKGVFFAVTTGNDVFALDETTGADGLDEQHRDAAPARGAGCGSISPIGIISTPVIDPGRARSTSRARSAPRPRSPPTRCTRSRSTTVRARRLAGRRLDDRPGRARAFSAVAAEPAQRALTRSRHPVRRLRRPRRRLRHYHGWVMGIDTPTRPSAAAGPPPGGGEGIWAAGGHGLRRQRRVRGHRQQQPAPRPTRTARRSCASPGSATSTRTNANNLLPGDLADHGPHRRRLRCRAARCSSRCQARRRRCVVAISKDGHMFLLDHQPGRHGRPPGDFMVATAAR